MRNLFILILFLLHACLLYAQPAEPRMSREEYIERYKDLAIREMLTHGIPASIKMAQAILESGDGNSPLARYANNHFGIKCHAGWDGPSFIQDDDEKDECFRKYRRVAESYTDHSAFLTGRKRYEQLFQLRPDDYKGWARGLKEAGYATNPKYADLLISLIERYKLYELDRTDVIATAGPVVDFPQKKVVNAHSRSLNTRNNINYVVALKGDNVQKIAESLDLRPWQILRYNDLKSDDLIKPGDIIYIQPKRRKAEAEYHIVKKGETMYTISQMHGIKLKHLYLKNHLAPGTQPTAGQKLWLRKKAPAP